MQVVMVPPTEEESLRIQRRKRDKPQLSCTPCRQRKVRCDRSQPCARCIQRQETVDCVYPVFQTLIPILSISSQDASQDQETQHRNASSRMTAQGSQGGFNSAGSYAGTEGTQVRSSQPIYVGSDHWTTLADNVAENQSAINLSSLSSPEEIMPDLLRGLCGDASKRDILACIPSRTELDTLVGIYFESLEASILITHKPSFLEQYERFWERPKSTPFTWLSMLFSIMCLASDYANGSGNMPRLDRILTQSDAVFLYRQRSAECLTLTDYTQPTTFLVEALFLYTLCELIRAKGSQFSISVLFATVVRIALRMGYHRDPRHLAHISVFEGELRRRVWSAVVQIDLLLAFQMGQQAVVRMEESDTEMPANIVDADLHAGLTSLPPPREFTPPDKLAYVLYRASISEVLGQIHRDVSSIHPLSHERVIELYNMLNKRFHEIPSCLKLDASTDCDDPPVMMRRVSIDLLFQKARCALHRRFITSKTLQHRLSKSICVDAALRVIEHQTFLHRESQPGRVFYGQGWKVLTWGTSHFLLAAMILCFALKTWDRDFSTASHGPESNPKVLYDALLETVAIWTEWKEYTKEADRIVAFVRIFLDESLQNNANWRSAGVDATATGRLDPPAMQGLVNIQPAAPLRPASIAAGAGSEMPSSYSSTEALGYSQNSIENILMSEYIDWSLWDTQMQDLS